MNADEKLIPAYFKCLEKKQEKYVKITFSTNVHLILALILATPSCANKKGQVEMDFMDLTRLYVSVQNETCIYNIT